MNSTDINLTTAASDVAHADVKIRMGATARLATACVAALVRCGV